jgi:hypothetical protein
MKTKLTLFTFLITLMAIAQSGINYKALIKDSNGNVIANQGIDMVFSIQIQGTTVYSELQQIVTDSNGIAIVTIGVGSVITGVFDTITWNLGDTELNVQIDFGDGLVDFGNSHFNAVPYAIETLNKEGLISVNEGSGSGWRLEGVILDGEEGYGAIGNNATDLSVTDANGVALIYPYGATGTGSFATGRNTIAFGEYANALGFGTLATGPRAFASGRETQASGPNSTAMGVFSMASGEVSFAIGASTEASGNYSTAMGRGTNATSSYSTTIGRYNVGGGTATTWLSSDPLFEIGNGSSDTNRSNALTVYKNGVHTINSEWIGLYIDEPGHNGISIISPGNYGISITDASQSGIDIRNSGLFGGSFEGVFAGISVRSSDAQNPDIILRGIDGTNQGDDGIIASDPSYTGSDIYLRSNDAIVAILDNDDNSSGSFIVRNGSDNNVFEVNENGVVRINGSVIHNSDRRLKTEITNLNYGLKEILQLQPKSYFWKDQDQHKKSLGLIAQDVQLIIDEIVTIRDDESETLGISYTELIPVLINAIKEQQAIINKQQLDNDLQKTELSELKDNYQSLLSRIERIESKTSN